MMKTNLTAIRVVFQIKQYLSDVVALTQSMNSVSASVQKIGDTYLSNEIQLLKVKYVYNTHMIQYKLYSVHPQMTYNMLDTPYLC
jgi:hypothetical protein